MDASWSMIKSLRLVSVVFFYSLQALKNLPYFPYHCQVDGIPLLGKSNQDAVEILKLTSTTVKLTIVRYLRGLKFEELRAGISQANVVTPTAPYLQTPTGENTSSSGGGGAFVDDGGNNTPDIEGLPNSSSSTMVIIQIFRES